jgi:hypothetical protein
MTRVVSMTAFGKVANYTAKNVLCPKCGLVPLVIVVSGFERKSKLAGPMGLEATDSMETK